MLLPQPFSSHIPQLSPETALEILYSFKTRLSKEKKTKHRIFLLVFYIHSHTFLREGSSSRVTAYNGAIGRCLLNHKTSYRSMVNNPIFARMIRVEIYLQYLYKPMRMVETDHMGFQVSGWKSLMERQSRVLGLNLPLGVIICILGGL